MQYRTCTFRHPQDLEVVPHPRQVPVPSSTLGTWKWSPTPRMLSLMNDQNKQRNPESEKSTKTKIRLVFYLAVSLFYEKVKVILWTIHTFWYKGLAKMERKSQV